MLRGLKGAWAVAEPRVYKTAPGMWGLGVFWSPSYHVAVQIGRYVFTTEPM